jgi:hypothetical protein
MLYMTGVYSTIFLQSKFRNILLTFSLLYPLESCDNREGKKESRAGNESRDFGNYTVSRGMN